jgi:hypothetical protein
MMMARGLQMTHKIVGQFRSEILEQKKPIHNRHSISNLFVGKTAHDNCCFGAGM